MAASFGRGSDGVPEHLQQFAEPRPKKSDQLKPIWQPAQALRYTI
jgi:hypothetical protein